ncbi:MAG: FAD-binding protein [Rhodospirillaceae bacterium]|nr:FAD-binding protein [Rhodospirillaceae bacterium]
MSGRCRRSRLVNASVGGAFAALLVACTEQVSVSQAPPRYADAIVVGAGLSGLAAAVEMGREDVNVVLLDMNSVMGGHAVMAGGFAIVDTPVQREAGFEDSAENAYADWMRWTEDGDPEWTRYYAENSRTMIYDWMAEMGIQFVRVQAGHENSVPRFHFTPRGALDVVLALYREALTLPGVAFEWNEKVQSLVVEEGRVTGVIARNLRTGAERTLHAPHVVLATGGFEGNLERVLEYWRTDLPKPDRLLLGASIHATGTGHDLAEEAGAGLTWMNRHYIYTNGMEDPRDPEQTLAITAGNSAALWVNAQGRRFTNETGFDKIILADVLDQEPTTYWMIFDESSRDTFSMRGREWINNPTDGHTVLDHPEATIRAESLEQLALMAGLPLEPLMSSVKRFNELIDAGVDEDFGRFDHPDDAPPKIDQAPFYAIQFFPMPRKSMGGVAIDMQARALNGAGEVVPGLYAVGELTGSVGINGTHGMDGMFLGPALVTGRIAGRTIANAVSADISRIPIAVVSPPAPMADAGSWEPVLTADDLDSLVALERDGYWHFEVSHELALERSYECVLCHSAQVPFAPLVNRQSLLVQSQVCGNCHGR